MKYEKVQHFKKIDRRRIGLFLLILTGVFARVFLFGSIPDGLNQDEAFAGYEAWNILTTGHDTMGYFYPLYLFTNGGGMNALETYLMIPFMAVFGPQDWVIRVPQVIVAIVSLPAVYGVTRRIYCERVGLWAALLVAWSPWHIMLSRWGLESNLAPGMLLFGMYFFLRGLEKKRYYIISALMYGLALYSYAMVWLYVPVILFVSVGYLILEKRLYWNDKVLWACIAIVGIMTIPLALVVLVNYGYIGEVSTRFFSIPKLDFLRTNQTSGYTIWQNAVNLCGILFLQTDGLIWNCVDGYGLYYPIGVLFILIGTAGTIRSFCSKCRRKEFAPELFVLLQFLCGVISGLISHVNVNRINIIFLPMLIMGGYGIEIFCRRLGEIRPRLRSIIPVLVLVVYAACFVSFERFYFVEYRQDSSAAFDAGLKEALQEAAGSGKTIHVNKSGIYPKVLYYLQMPVDEYIATRVFSDWHPMPQSAGNLYFDMGNAVPNKNGVFILEAGADLKSFEDAGFEVKQYGSCSYVYYPE